LSTVKIYLMCFTANREIMRIIKKILTVTIALPFYLINKLIDFLSVFSLHFKKISCDYQWNYLESLTKKSLEKTKAFFLISVQILDCIQFIMLS